MYISLLLHGIEKKEPESPYSVEEGVFRECVTRLKTKGLKCESLREIKDGKAIALTFDDGLESDYTIAFPLLMESAMRASFFVITETIGKAGSLQGPWVREMAERGMEIGSHTATHRYLTGLKNGEMRNELSSSKKRLEDVTGMKVDSVAFPGGEFNKSIAEAALEAGYERLATSRPGFNRSAEGLVKRICVRNRTGVKELESIIGFSRPCLYRREASYVLRALIKKGMGVERYRKIRDCLFQGPGL